MAYDKSGVSGVRIWCSKDVRPRIKEYLLSELGDMMKKIGCDREEVVVEEKDDGLFVDFPSGEVYGEAYEYVYAFPYVFYFLKRKYSDIGIYGFVCEYETHSASTVARFFYCDSSDKKLKVTEDCQVCISCKKIIEGHTFYDCVQKEVGEGGDLECCLCSPTCMLEFCLSKLDGVRLNNSFSEDEREAYEISNNQEKLVKRLLWNRIVENVDSYIEDFREKKNRIFELIDYKGLDIEKKAFLMEIANKIR